MYQAMVLIQESRPVQWVLIREERIASAIHCLWLAGCVYWVYQLIIVEAKPRPDLLYTFKDTSEALMILFFGSFSLLYVVSIALFIFKFIYKLFTEGIESILPGQWHSVAKSAGYIVILGFSFLYIHNIKVAGLTAYQQVTRLVQTSERHEEVVEHHYFRMKELFDKTTKPVE